MSGPKVLVPCTREEVMAICKEHLSVLESTFKQWETCAKDNNMWSLAQSEELLRRKQEIRNLFQREEWLAVQKRAPNETEFIRTTIERIREAAIEKAERERNKRRRICDAARSLIDEYVLLGLDVPFDLKDFLNTVLSVKGEDISKYNKMLNNAYNQLVSIKTNKKLVNQHNELAIRLANNQVEQSYIEWLDKNGFSISAKHKRLDRLLAEISVLDQDIVETITSRVKMIETEESDKQRDLLTDSLILEVSHHIKQLRAWVKLLPDFENARAILNNMFSTESKQLLEQANEIALLKNVERAKSFINKAADYVMRHEKHKVAESRRNLIFKGLSSLGYEIREDMMTALVKNKRVILRRPNVNDYGLELSALQDMDKIQIRVVGADNPSEPRTEERDRDAETEWCGQLAKLQKFLSEEGAQLLIEKALAAGATPIKSIHFEDVSTHVTSDISRPIERRIGGI